jgi:hypothetical protein
MAKQMFKIFGRNVRRPLVEYHSADRHFVDKTFRRRGYDPVIWSAFECSASHFKTKGLSAKWCLTKKRDTKELLFF